MTESLGRPGSGAPRIDIEHCGLLDGDVMLLCTHGLTSMAPDSAIAEVLRSRGTADEQSRALIDLAEQASGPDDATALVAHYTIRPWSTPADTPQNS